MGLIGFLGLMIYSLFIFYIVKGQDKATKAVIKGFIISFIVISALISLTFYVMAFK